MGDRTDGIVTDRWLGPWTKDQKIIIIKSQLWWVWNINRAVDNPNGTTSCDRKEGIIHECPSGMRVYNDLLLLFPYHNISKSCFQVEG